MPGSLLKILVILFLFAHYFPPPVAAGSRIPDCVSISGKQPPSIRRAFLEEILRLCAPLTVAWCFYSRTSPHFTHLPATKSTCGAPLASAGSYAALGVSPGKDQELHAGCANSLTFQRHIEAATPLRLLIPTGQPNVWRICWNVFILIFLRLHCPTGWPSSLQTPPTRLSEQNGATGISIDRFFRRSLYATTLKHAALHCRRSPIPRPSVSY